MRLKNKKSIVTGGGSGIGRVIARGLASEGAAVVVVDLHLDKALETVESILSEGQTAYGMEADTSQRAQVDSMISKSVDQLGKLDTLVCSAGISPLELPRDWTSGSPAIASTWVPPMTVDCSSTSRRSVAML